MSLPDPIALATPFFIGLIVLEMLVARFGRGLLAGRVRFTRRTR
jgi:hypothetical protein